MNLIKHAPPEIEFILDIHEEEFIKQVIDGYFEVAKMSNGSIPSANEIAYSPVFMYASALYDEHGDMDIVKKEITGFADEDDLIEHCLSELDELEIEWPQLLNHYRDNVMDDIITAFDYYHLCYLNGFYDPFRGKTTYFIHNEPIIHVW